MKKIKEEITLEEIETLLNGGTIDFLENQSFKLQISGKKYLNSSKYCKFFAKVLNKPIIEFSLMMDILWRYDNTEYWDKELIEYLEKE